MPDQSETVDELLLELQSVLNKPEPDFRNIVKLSNHLAKLDPHFQRFTVDAKTLIHLGRDSIKDHTTALIELVKNSYDADAYNIEVDIFCKGENDTLRVSDNGFGMTRSQLINNWLRIGFSEKRQSKESELGRRKTGEKGIGRISTDRLGARLELRSLTEDNGLVGLKVDWDKFDTEGMDVSDIEVELFHPTSISIPRRNGEMSSSGTEIIIHGLRQPWTSTNIENLFNELATLTPPFEDVKDFEISLNNDVAPQFSKRVSVDFQNAALIELEAIFDGSDEVYYSIKEKGGENASVQTISLNHFFARSDPNKEHKNITLNCGPVNLKFFFFLRDGSSVMGQKFKLSDLRDFLDNNAGVKIYRDQIAVKPYGFPSAQLGYDWLSLGERRARNPAGVGRSADYTISPNQLVGAVYIKRDENPSLTDSAAREGLVESEAFYDLKSFVMASLKLLESYRAGLYKDQEAKQNEQKKQKQAHREAINITQQLDRVKINLADIKFQIESARQPVDAKTFVNPIDTAIVDVNNISQNVGATINDLLDWQRTLGGLATMGISFAVFGHETEGSITQFQGSTQLALKLIKQPIPKFSAIEIELDKAVKHSKKIAAWGSYALTRIQREKRKKGNISISKVIEGVLNELQPVFEASSIQLKFEGEKFYTKSYQMDIESILINLLTNAYTACQQKGGKREVLVKSAKELAENKEGFFISVEDSGPGIAKEFKHMIFEPLFSTKTIGANESKSIGTGLGLTVVKSIVEDLYGSIIFDSSPKLKGARFKIWLPKEN